MNTPKRPLGRSLLDFLPLNSAEQKLLDACRNGAVAEITEGRPEAETATNLIRAGFIRFLALGGDDSTPVHEQGIRIDGAWIEGELNLENTVTRSAIACLRCTFTHPLILRRSNLPAGLFLQGSSVPGIKADGLRTGGSLLFRDGFKSTKTIRLLGAHIGGNLDCSAGYFDGDGEDAIVADRVNILGNAFLCEEFRSTGEVRLLGARINGDLSCQKGRFNGNGDNALSLDGAKIGGNVFLSNDFEATGEVRLLGTRIGNNLDCCKWIFNGKNSSALCAEGVVVSGAFFFRNLKKPVHRISLTGASVGQLVDDPVSWGSSLSLDGFIYGSFIGNTPPTASERIAWLDKQQVAMSGLSGNGVDFRPQPWRHLQKVLREMGHIEDAREVAIAFEDRLRTADLIGMSPQHWGRARKWLYRFFSRTFHVGFRVLTGYGYRPLRMLAWFVGVWLTCASFYWFTALPSRNAFAPSDPLVFQNTAYAACVPDSAAAEVEQVKPANASPAPVRGAGNWYLCESLPQEYTGFSPLAYSLDVILPLVDLQQEKDWAPRIPTAKAAWWQELLSPSWGHAARLVLWFETLFGWLASLLLVAIVSGLTKRRED